MAIPSADRLHLDIVHVDVHHKHQGWYGARHHGESEEDQECEPAVVVLASFVELACEAPKEYMHSWMLEVTYSHAPSPQL
jgi:hypothetical protein